MQLDKVMKYQKIKLENYFKKNKRILKYDNKNLKYIAVFKKPKYYKVGFYRDEDNLKKLNILILVWKNLIRS